MNENSALKSVLIVDDDRDFLICVENFLKVYTDQIDVLIAVNGLQALQILENRKVDLLITDIKMPEMDGIELLSRLSLKKLDLNVIVTTAFATKENIERLNKIGQFYYMPKPFSLEIFGKKILSVLKEKSEAFVNQFTLTNLLQLIEMEQKTCTLRVKTNGKVGYLYLQKGALINAATNEIEGLEAAKTIISWRNAQTEIQGSCRAERKIHTALMSILLEATRIADENRVSLANTDSLEKAVELAEGRHFKEAKAILAQLLKHDNRNARAWLWFSRVVENEKSIKVTLTNAAKIAPTDPEIAAEYENFSRILSLLNEEHFHRCPFCWSPFKKGSYQCPNCGGHLTVYDGLLKSAPVGDNRILKRTVERFNRAVGREKNAKAHYYLGLAHLNLANWEDALNHLDKSVKLEPTNKSYGYQLQTLLNHVASAKAVPAEGLHSQQKELNHSRASQQSPVKRNKILVVEDSSTIRKVISVTLSQSGYEIIEAGDGLEALSKLNESSPDLILLDIILPKMDGYKILSIIKENPDFCDIPVIMLTSKDGILNKVKGKMAGSAAYLTKPFDPSQLVETIERHLK